MLHIRKFTFNPFQENTFIIWGDTKECAIIDPGCYRPDEKTQLADFIATNGLTPVKLLNTHCHIDHVFGNAFVSKTYNLMPVMHIDDMPVLKSATAYGNVMGMDMEAPPIPTTFLNVNEPITFGDITLRILFTPGHAPGHVSFYHKESNSVFSGDVLFQGSVGRFDLPGGSYEVLIESIKTQLLTLPDNTTVYCGHGPETSIGRERVSNPFVLEAMG